MDSWDTLKRLADPTRLRIIRLLWKEELSVAELQEILEMGQSRISSHLSLLKSGQLVLDRKEGKRSYYSLNRELPIPTRQLVDAICENVAADIEIQQDEIYLQRILKKRKKLAEQYFNEVAGRLGKNYCPGRSWESIGHLMMHLTPPIVIADLGAGEGVLSQMLARNAQQVYCIDNSPKMVEVGSELARQHEIENLEYKLGDLEDVPLEDCSVDIALLSQALHHALHPRKAIKEAVRILKPGGQLLVLDLKEHNFEKARELYADHWLGFKENDLYDFFHQAGLKEIEVRIVYREAKVPYFETVLAVGRKETEN